MTTPQRPTAVDPKSYSLRDLLLITQIMHTNGLIQPEQVSTSDRLDELASAWFSHSGSVLSRNQGQFPLDKALSSAQLVNLYENMLEDNENCKNTTDLANTFYFARIAELESRIGSAKTGFRLALEKLQSN